METYAVHDPPFGPQNSLMSPDQGLQPRPDGTVVNWISTTLKFKFQAWVPETYVDIYIVQQKVGRKLPDPWGVMSLDHNHQHQYLPYTLPQWRNIGSKPMSGNWIDRAQYNIIAHRKIFMDSVAEVPPVGSVHTGVDNVVDAVTQGGDIGHQAHATKNASTHACKYASITIKPNMVMKQLKAAIDSDGDDVMTFNANENEQHTIGPWSYDNIDPKQKCAPQRTTHTPAITIATLTRDHNRTQHLGHRHHVRPRPRPTRPQPRRSLHLRAHQQMARPQG